MDGRGCAEQQFEVGRGQCGDRSCVQAPIHATGKCVPTRKGLGHRDPLIEDEADDQGQRIAGQHRIGLLITGVWERSQHQVGGHPRSLAEKNARRSTVHMAHVIASSALT